MAAPTFGFSIGDFIAVIELAIEVYKACRETGGAQYKSKLVLDELGAYIALLQRLQGCNNEASEEIKKLVSICQIPVQEFFAKMKGKWEGCDTSTISKNPIKNILRSTKAFRRKVEWALFDANEVERLRTQIAQPLSAIGRHLDLELRSSQSANNTMVAQKLDVIASLNLRNRKATRLLSRNMLKVQEDCNSMMQGYYQQSIAQCLVVYGNFEDLRAHIQKMIDSIPPRIAQKPRARTTKISTRNNINEVGDVLTCGDAFLLFIRLLIAPLRGWITQVLLPFLRGLQLLFTIIPAAPSLLLSDNITFMDVLGRRASLSYVEFSHWPVFEARLRVAFQGLPGEKKVLQGQYRLLDTSRDKLLSPQRWRESVAPRSRIIMSVVVDGIKMKKGLCSQPACNLEIGDRALCPRCGTTSYEESLASYSTRRGLSTTNVDTLTATLSSTYISRPAQDKRADAATPIPTHKDREQEDEVRYFKFIHVLKAKLSAHGTVGFVHASRNSQLSLNEQLLKTMIKPLKPKEREGYLFISVADDAPELCRISSTSRPIHGRLQEIHRSCQRRPTLVKDPGQRCVSNMSRLEKLVHIELSEYQRTEERCKGCSMKHYEWFELSPEKALAVIERGMRWLDLQPYDADGLLKQTISPAAWLNRWLGT